MSTHKLSSQAQEIYDNIVKNLNPIVNNKKLQIVNLGASYWMPLTVLEIQPDALDLKLDSAKQKMLWVFDQGVQRGIFQLGVFSHIYTKELSSVDLGKTKIIAFHVFSEMHPNEINKAFGVNAYSSPIVSYEAAVVNGKFWDDFIVPHD